MYKHFVSILKKCLKHDGLITSFLLNIYTNLSIPNTHKHMHAHKCTHMHRHAHMHACLHVHRHACMHACMCNLTQRKQKNNIYMLIHVHSQTRTHTHIYRLIHIHTYTVTYTYTHIQSHTVSYTYTPILSHTHTHIYILIHTHTHTKSRNSSLDKIFRDSPGCKIVIEESNG